MKLDYFGARYYDPEVGVWTSTDPKEQLFNPYGYSSNSINSVDPDGQFIIGALIGAAVGAYLGGAMANMSFDPSQWDYGKVSTWTGMIGGAFNGGSLGSNIEDNIILNDLSHGANNAYENAAGAHYINNGKFTSYTINKYANEPTVVEGQVSDAYILNDPNGAKGFGHSAILDGNDDLGYYYFEKGGNQSINTASYYDSYDAFIKSDVGKRYPNGYKINTSYAQDIKMIDCGFNIYDTRYNTYLNNCGDLTGDILNAGGFRGGVQGITWPNAQYNFIKMYNPGVVVK